MLRQEEEGEEEGDSDCEIQQLKQKIRLRRQQIRRSRLPPCASSQHSKTAFAAAKWKSGHLYGHRLMLNLLSVTRQLKIKLVSFVSLVSSPSCNPVFHSTDSGGSRRSSQDSCQGLSDSGSAEEVEECELRGRERE